MTCDKCHGSGLIPFVKNGRVIANAWVDCECKQLEPERYQPVTPDMFDYPCSDTFRAYSYQYCNQPDPGYIPPEPEAPPPQVQVVTEYKYVVPITNKKPTYKDISA